MGKHTPYTKLIYDVSKNSTKLSNPIPAAPQPHKFYVKMLGFEEIGKRYRIERKYYNRFMINYSVQGSAKLVYNYATYTLEKGDLCMTYDYNPLTLSPKSEKDYDWVIYFLHIFGDDVKDIFNEIAENNIVLLHNFPIGKIKPLFLELFETIKNPTEGSENRVSALTHELLLNIRDYAKSSPSNETPNLNHVIEYIKRNFSNPITLDDIVHVSFFSKSHLNSLFIEALNITPMQYVMNLRIKKAQELLCTTKLTMKEIAQDCGFKSDRALIYTFKTHCEITPQQLRSSARKANLVLNAVAQTNVEEN